MQVDFHDMASLDGSDGVGIFNMNLRTVSSDQTTAPILTAFFTFPVIGADQRLFLLEIEGDATLDDQMQRFMSKAAHSSWSDTEAAKALSSEGAKFGPNEVAAVREKLKTYHLELLVGQYVVEKSWFSSKSLEGTGIQRSGEHFLWHVQIRTSDSHLQPLHYIVTLEPFDARVISVARDPLILSTKRCEETLSKGFRGERSVGRAHGDALRAK